MKLYRLKKDQMELIEQAHALYRKAFPSNERVDLSQLLDEDQYNGEILYFDDHGAFAGFMSLLSCGNITHITYFAVEPSERGKGIGSRALALLKQRYPNQIIIADLETPKEGAENEPQRLARVHFYEKNGFSKTEVAYTWEHEDYEIYSCQGIITDEQFNQFWETLSRRLRP